jgi:4-amino-4-deoxy-L-arabinose transferase-like glycosyltransferase
VAGFALAGLATLVKGPLGFVLPALASLAFLLVRRRARDLLCRDVGAGLLIAAGLVGGWLLACRVVAGEGFLERLFADQIVARTMASPRQREGGLYYWRVLPLLALPWTVAWIALAVGWLRRWRQRAHGGARAALRTVDATGDGVVFLAVTAIVHMAVLSAMSYKLALYLLHVLPPLSVLTVRLLLAGDPHDLRRVRQALALLFAVLALLLPWVPRFAPWPEAVRGLGWAAAAFAALGLALWLMRDRPAAPLAAAVALGVTVAVQPLVLVTRPALDAVMSPRGIGEIVQGYARRGYVPVTYQIRDYRRGTLSYYAGQVVRDVEDPGELRALLEGPRSVVVLTLAGRLGSGDGVLRRLTPVHRQRLDRDRWVVLVSAR